MGSRLFGRCWHNGDVVGCMINMEDKSMIFTLNGEILITTKGSELCFTDFETEDGESQLLKATSDNSDWAMVERDVGHLFLQSLQSKEN